MKQILHTDAAPAAVGPYSQAVRAGNLLFISGQLGLDPESGTLAGDDIRKQTEQVLLNIKAILMKAGLTPADVVKATVYLSDINDFKAMNEIYGLMFNAEPPARAAFQVAALPLAAKVEIEAIALIHSNSKFGAS